MDCFIKLLIVSYRLAIDPQFTGTFGFVGLDAENAINAGADAILVSNHGARQLDGVSSTVMRSLSVHLLLLVSAQLSQLSKIVVAFSLLLLQQSLIVVALFANNYNKNVHVYHRFVAIKLRTHDDKLGRESYKKRWNNLGRAISVHTAVYSIPIIDGKDIANH